jgi:ABC-type transporter Mla subunit MlaD
MLTPATGQIISRSTGSITAATDQRRSPFVSTDGNATAKQKMAHVIVQDVRHDIGGDVQRIDTVATSYSDETFKHILLPIWIAAYKYNAKTYRFLVNGQTGEVQGERPYSVWKITFAALAVAVVAAVAYVLIQKYGNGG